ncbi:two-component system, cell cycle response regulator [Alkalispirochaeta americana]|uniref:diguanylate cyclase n=1 Tax=Alkalispirochaeta americana TaxID=159291 RepID=A0A1N6N6R9_9SPIO|nr:response regulator [Alkalispirochaeta americana]SIP87798.1 two-component system, cell cycle response regulator [Alkalispirochaeta americana]
MLRILHIDRSELFRKVMRELVTRCGHSVVSVPTKEDALETMAQEEIDLVVTALKLDDGGAESLITAMAGTPSRDIPVIVVTSTDSLEQRERLFSLGVVEYMLKNELSEDRFIRYLETLASDDELSRFMRTLKIAVVDDSQVTLKIVSRILSMNGFSSVTLFDHPEKLLQEKDPFDLYICDIVLPGISGDHLVSLIRQEHQDAIIISMSQFSGERSLSNILGAGADDYIHKPFDSAGLMARIKVNVRSYQLKKRLEMLAVTDGLTGLYNHRYSYDRLEQEISKAKRYQRELSVAMIDVDDFKGVNDTQGHRKGDEVLAGIARLMEENLRKCDIVGRYGGEEFLAIFPETDLDDARVVADKLRRVLADHDFQGSGITVSAGVAAFDGKESAQVLVSRADALLYRAKHQGKNRIEG